MAFHSASSVYQNRQETGLSLHTSPSLIRSMHSAGASKHPSHPICQANTFHLHVIVFFSSPPQSVSPIYCVIAVTEWDRRKQSSRLSEHMQKANRVEWPNRLGYLKSQG